MKIAMIIIRSLMGVLLLFASISYLLKLTPVPVLTGDMKVYNEGLAVVNLMLYVKIIELICGLALLLGRFVALALIVIFPIILNIVLFHGVVAPSAIGPGLFLLAGALFLAFYYREKYAPLFSSK